MKKLTLLFAAGAMTASVFAVPSWVEFSSVGPDKYADGSVVQDGEVYALVWTKDGTTFEGITAKGEVVNAETSKIVAMAPLAKNGHCETVFYSVKDSDDYVGGQLAVYLLDTRVIQADGSQKVTGIAEDGTFTAVNSYDAVTATVGVGTAAKADAVTGEGAVVSAVPADAPTPTVKSIQVIGGQVKVTVGNTVPYLQYTISSGDTLKDMKKNELVNGVNGSANGDITLIVNDPADNRFFKVIRK